MAKQLINLGTPNGRDGDTVRVAFTKINENFNDLYTSIDLNNIGTNVRPDVSGTHDIGGVDRVWHAVWVGPEGVHIGDKLLSVDGAGAVTVDGIVIATPNGAAANVDWSATAGSSSILNKPTLSAVATTGSYTDLLNAPAIPAQVSDLTNDLNYSTFSGSYTDLVNKPILFSGSYFDLRNRPSLFMGDYTELVNKPELFSGSYIDLNNKPTIPTDLSQLADSTGLLGSVSSVIDGGSAASF
jgi:hypothetical protein